MKKKKNNKVNPVAKANQMGEHGPRPAQQVHKNEKDYNRQVAKRVVREDSSDNPD